MFGAVIINVIAIHATIPLFRAALAGAAGQFSICRQTDVDQLYQWSDASTAADDGASVVKPDSIIPAIPGRWLLVATVDSNDVPTVGTNIISVPWNNANAVIRHGEGWRCVGVSGTHVYFAKDVVGT